GNIVEIGESTVSAGGMFFGKDFAYLGRNALTPDDVPTNPMLYGRKSVTDITTSGREGFPENKSGQLVTCAYEERSAYQEFNVFQSYRKFKRVWYYNSEEWSPWELTETVVGNTSANRND